MHVSGALLVAMLANTIQVPMPCVIAGVGAGVEVLLRFLVVGKVILPYPAPREAGQGTSASNGPAVSSQKPGLGRPPVSKLFTVSILVCLVRCLLRRLVPQCQGTKSSKHGHSAGSSLPRLESWVLNNKHIFVVLSRVGNQHAPNLPNPGRDAVAWPIAGKVPPGKLQTQVAE